MSGISEMRALRGRGVSEGIAIGRAVVVDSRAHEIFRSRIREDEVDAELERLDRALVESRRELGAIGREAGRELGEELAGIFEAQGLLLGDEAFLRPIRDRIRHDLVNAEWAVFRTGRTLAKRFERLELPHLRERAEDVRDLCRHVLDALLGTVERDRGPIDGPLVAVAHDLTPSEAIRLGRKGILGFAIETGGPTSHTAIIARSLGIPLVEGLPGVSDLAADEDDVILDGETGLFVLHPSEELLRDYGERQLEIQSEIDALSESRDLEAVTRDGVGVTLRANIDLLEELPEARRVGSRGVGLYRSEFFFIERSPEIPGEEEQYRRAIEILEASAGAPAVVRTYDLGGRKLAREVMGTEEENPAMGLRGLRLTMARPNLFRTQLRALYRAAAEGDLRILLPMVTSLDEVRAFREFAAEITDELEEEGIPHDPDAPIGLMIEVPAAAMTADALAREADFLALGTNDLIQYSLAADRNNEHVADLYEPLHPAILRMVRFVIESAAAARIPVSMCGEMAGDARYTGLLLGLGLREFSVSPHKLPGVKAQVRRTDIGQLERIALECLQAATAEEVEELLGI